MAKGAGHQLHPSPGPTGEAPRLHTALRRWARFSCGKALSALHLALKKASSGGHSGRAASAALQTNRSAPQPRSAQERPASRLAWTKRLPLGPSPPRDVIGRRRSWATVRGHLPVAPSPQNDVTGPCPSGGGALEASASRASPSRWCHHRAPTRGDAIRHRRTVEGQGARAVPQPGWR